MVNMIISSDLIIKEKNNEKKYYIKFTYDNNIVETYLASSILDSITSKKNYKQIEEKQNWIKRNHPELFI
jgi:hypothetical protein